MSRHVESVKNALLLNTLGQRFHTSSIFVGKYLRPRKKAEVHTLLRNQSLEWPEKTLLIPVKQGDGRLRLHIRFKAQGPRYSLHLIS